MTDHTEVIKLLQDQVRTLDFLSTPTPNVVTEHFARENIAKAVKIHAAIHDLQSVSSKYQQGYAMALSDAEEAIDEECRERVVTASGCIEIIRNLGETK